MAGDLHAPTSTDPTESFLSRTRRLLGEEALRVLRDATVALPGCGGVGGATAVLLARMGIGGFLLADPGNFDEPDLNRQWGATCSTLGQPKVQVYEKLIREINPRARIDSYPEGVTPENLERFLAKADVVVDGLDLAVPLALRLRLYEMARRRGLFCLSSPIMGVATVLMCAAPDGMPLAGVICDIIDTVARRGVLPAGFREQLFPEHVDALEQGVREGVVPSIGIAPAFSAGFVSSEILVILLRRLFAHWREPIALPNILVIEAMRPNCRIVHYRELCPDLARRNEAAAQPPAAVQPHGTTTMPREHPSTHAAGLVRPQTERK